jgi:hypothetical protein
MWFEKLTGFREVDAAGVRAKLQLDGETFVVAATGRRMRCGRFEMPSLAELRVRLQGAGGASGAQLRELVADIRDIHRDPASAGALFQVASQFNMLEMVSPQVTPDQGVDGYEHDHTQGPTCAIACGAGTIYRNYFVPVGDAIGQTATRQLNGLADLLVALEVAVEVRNGYALPTSEQLLRLSERLGDLDEPERDRLMGHLRIGLQWDTEVTIAETGHVVTQAYCSALPIAYTSHPAQSWEPFARLVLDAAYEAAFAAAVSNSQATGNRTLYLTLLGAGAFGNPASWVTDAIGRARRLFVYAGLDVVIVSYKQSAPAVKVLVEPPPSWADRLFDEPPRQWGMRGDPCLWAELRDRLRARPEPRDTTALRGLLREELRQLCGVDVLASDVDGVHLERYPTAGMSGGVVSAATWRDRLVPLLAERLDRS